MNLILVTLAIGVCTFFVSTMYFASKPKTGLNTPFIVSIITLISYLIMIEGKFLIGNPDTGIYWTRWVGYAISCPLLMYAIAKKLDYSPDQTVFNMILTAIVMLTGAYAGVSNGDYKWIFFGLSTFAFVMLLTPIFGSKSSFNKSMILPYILLGWCGFPIVFLLSYEGFGLIQNGNALIAYLLLDFMTKIVFYIQMYKSKN